MKQSTTVAFAVLAASTVVTTAVLARSPAAPAPASSQWNAKAAAAYLDGRAAWWLQWPTAARDHDTACVSCHTMLPYALARPALRSALGEAGLAAPERGMIANVTRRVQLWREVEPFYSDQTRGLPKTSESRGTEAVLNAVVLATRDASAGALSADTRQALDNMWALQFKAGDLKGAWAWLQFHNDPWEGNDSAYMGATLAALAIGAAPGYASSPDIQERLASLREYLQRRADTETLFNRLMVLWASANVPGLLSPAQRTAIVDAAVAKQQPDGGWSTASLGPFARQDGTALDTASDGYGTGLVALALRQSGIQSSDEHVRQALAWLARHQDAATGMWYASSLNKQRDRNSDVGKFMSDAATAYAVLALTPRAAQSSTR